MAGPESIRAVISRDDAKAAGLKRFFTGVPCKYGHVCERQVSNRVCLECHRLKFTDRYQANPKARREYLERWREEHRNSLKRYYAKNIEAERERQRRKHVADPSKALERMRRWRQQNPELARIRYALENVKKIRRFMPWSNRKEIEAVYAQAARLTAETGIPHHVDHIIPLRGKLVSGLHVQANLRVIPAVDNLRKGNRVPPEMLA